MSRVNGEERLDGVVVDEYQIRVSGTLDIEPDIVELLRLDGLVVCAAVFRIGKAEFEVDEESGTAKRKDILKLQSLLPVGLTLAREQIISFIKHGNPQGVLQYEPGITDKLPMSEKARAIIEEGLAPKVKIDEEMIFPVQEPETVTVGGTVVNSDGEVVDRTEPEPTYEDGFNPDDWDFDLPADATPVGDTIGHVKGGPTYSDDPAEPGRRKTAAEEEAARTGRTASVTYDDLLDLGGNPEGAVQPVGEQVGAMRDYRGGDATETDRLVEQI